MTSMDLVRSGRSKNFIDSDTPAGHGRLGVSHLADYENIGMIGSRCSVTADASSNRIDVPHARRTRLEVVGTLASHGLLGRIAVVALAANLDSQRRRSINEFHFV